MTKKEKKSVQIFMLPCHVGLLWTRKRTEQNKKVYYSYGMPYYAKNIFSQLLAYI